MRIGADRNANQWRTKAEEAEQEREQLDPMPDNEKLAPRAGLHFSLTLECQC
jgi:hypothetical protein